MDVKGKVLLQLFNKSRLRNGTKTFLEPKFFSMVKFKKLEFSAPLRHEIDLTLDQDVFTQLSRSVPS